MILDFLELCDILDFTYLLVVVIVLMAFLGYGLNMSTLWVAEMYGFIWLWMGPARVLHANLVHISLSFCVSVRTVAATAAPSVIALL